MIERPKIRKDCQNIPRPCPFISCKYHLYCDIIESSGKIKKNTNLEPWKMDETCLLDLIDENPGGLTYKKMEKYMNMTRQGVQQWVAKGIRHLKRNINLTKNDTIKDNYEHLRKLGEQ